MLARILHYAKCVLVLAGLVLGCLYFCFTLAPQIGRTLGFFQSETISVNGESLSLDKAIIAKACNSDGKSCINNVLLLTGYIDEGMLKKVEELANDHQVKTLCFASRGGSKEAAIKLGYWITKSHSNTCMAEKYLTENGLTITNPVCASACPYILAMGEQRTALGSQYEIGIHSSGMSIDFGLFSFTFNSRKSDAVDKYQEMLKSSNSSAEHIQMLSDSLETGFESKRYLTPEEQSQYALFTKYH